MKQFWLIAILFVSFTLVVSLTSCREAIVDNNNPVDPVNVQPDVPSNPTPADNSTNVTRFPTLQWLGGDPNASDTVRYDVVIGTVNPPVTVIASGTLVTAVDVGPVAANTVFYWKVTAKDNHNTFTEGPVWKFTTGN
jgi:hypothetical protein